MSVGRRIWYALVWLFVIVAFLFLASHIVIV